MTRPYVSVETILEKFCSNDPMPSGQPAADDCLRWLAEFLAREHATMNAQEWDALVHVGSLLWRAREVWDGTPRMH